MPVRRPMLHKLAELSPTPQVSMMCHLSRHPHGRPPPIYQSRDGLETLLSKCRALSSSRQLGDGRGTVVPPASRSMKKVAATKMNVGREGCIEATYIMKLMRMVAVASAGFCPFWTFLKSIFFIPILSREQFVPQLFCRIRCSQVGGCVQPW